MDHSNVSITDLRRWSARTFDVLEAAGRKEIAVPLGLYWLMEPEDLWVLPTAMPTAGDTRDDITTLNEELAQPIDELVDWHSLGHLVGILSVVASQITPSLRREARS
mgnify:CR=1 FL=1